MSLHSSHERAVTIGEPEILEVFGQKPNSLTDASINIDSVSKYEGSSTVVDHVETEDKNEEIHQNIQLMNSDEIDRILKEQEEQLRANFLLQLETEKGYLKDRFEFILHNEQVRATHMLREAHKECQERVHTLKTELECRNLAALMYVMCSERSRGKFEKLRVIDDYTKYILMLQDILVEAQLLILYLSREYKTAARVDHEWRVKMKKVIKEFQNFVHHFCGGGKSDLTQYLIDLPPLLKTKVPTRQNPEENPCFEPQQDEVVMEEEPENKSWWQRLDEGEDRPFVMFGDMDDFKAPQRRHVLTSIRPDRTAPARWREYAFNDMFKNFKCSNVDQIRREYQKAEENQQKNGSNDGTNSDFHHTIAAMLKTMTTSGGTPRTPANSTILGARDSMEIASSTKVLMREKNKNTDSATSERVVLHIGNRKTSKFDVLTEEKDFQAESVTTVKSIRRNSTQPPVSTNTNKVTYEKPVEEPPGLKITKDMIDLEHDMHEATKVAVDNYKKATASCTEYNKALLKVCPIENCKNMRMDSFIRSLPAYMKASPYMHYEQPFDKYDTCTEEQLEILQKRIEDRKNKDQSKEVVIEVDPLTEWKSSEGLGVQTSKEESSPPCLCNASFENKSSSRVFRLEDLLPMKHTMDHITQEFLFDPRVQFDRFKVIGDDSGSFCSKPEPKSTKCGGQDKSRLQEIGNILKSHPSMCLLFQANC